MAERRREPGWYRSRHALVEVAHEALREAERGEQKMSLYLKIKEQSLAAEARIIRVHELRLKRRIAKHWKKNAAVIQEWGATAKAAVQAEMRPAEPPNSARTHDKMEATRNGLHEHRTKDVRGEARATHLARGFLKGMPYAQMEAVAWTAPPLDRAQTLVEKYGPGDVATQVTMQRYAEWAQAAKAAHKIPPKRERHPRGSHRTLAEWQAIQAKQEFRQELQARTGNG